MSDTPNADRMVARFRLIMGMQRYISRENFLRLLCDELVKANLTIFETAERLADLETQLIIERAKL